MVITGLTLTIPARTSGPIVIWRQKVSFFSFLKITMLTFQTIRRYKIILICKDFYPRNLKHHGLLLFNYISWFIVSDLIFL